MPPRNPPDYWADDIERYENGLRNAAQRLPAAPAFVSPATALRAPPRETGPRASELLDLRLQGSARGHHPRSAAPLGQRARAHHGRGHLGPARQVPEPHKHLPAGSRRALRPDASGNAPDDHSGEGQALPRVHEARRQGELSPGLREQRTARRDAQDRASEPDRRRRRNVRG